MAAMLKQSRVSEGRRRCRLRALAEIDSVKNDKRHFPYIFKTERREGTIRWEMCAPLQ